MREIKFRLWDKKHKRFFHWGFVDKEREDLVFIGLPDSGFGTITEKMKMSEQFTGLKDAKEKEIYEGDILKCKEDVMLVIWNEQFASFCLAKAGWLYHHFFGEGADPKDCEVIGNTHENFELLKP